MMNFFKELAKIQFIEKLLNLNARILHVYDLVGDKCKRVILKVHVCNASFKQLLNHDAKNHCS